MPPSMFIVIPLVTGTFAGLIAAGIAHIIQTRRAKVLPYLPSYREAFSGPHDAATRFFASVHEMTMSVTEAWNAKHARSTGKGSVEESLNLDHLTAACDGVQTEGAALLNNLKDYARIATSADGVSDKLAWAWSYDSRDNYRTETYTEWTTGSDGKRRSETKTRRVYDSTDHTFKFDRSHAQQAKARAEELQQIWSGATLNPPRVNRARVDLRKLDPVDRMLLERIYKTTVLENAKAQVTEVQLKTAINQWIAGTTIDAHLSTCTGGIQQFLKHQQLLDEILLAAPVYKYRTHSRTDSGPEPYRHAQQLRGMIERGVTGWNRVSTMITTCQEAAGNLKAWGTDNSEIEEDSDYSETAVKAYTAAFPNSSLEVDQLVDAATTWIAGLVTGAIIGGFTAIFMYIGARGV